MVANKYIKNFCYLLTQRELKLFFVRFHWINFKLKKTFYKLLMCISKTSYLTLTDHAATNCTPDNPVSCIPVTHKIKQPISAIKIILQVKTNGH